MKAKKSLGQHFLVQPDIAHNIVNSVVRLPANDRIVEVGAGRGMLSKYLLRSFPGAIMIETDADLIPVLQKNLPQNRDQIIHADFLHLDLGVIFQGKPFTLIGNFPYNISSQILFKVIENRTLVPQLVGMFQKEVADRIVSGHGSKSYGILSVLSQVFYDIRILFSVSPGSFLPRPNVNSAVIRMNAKSSVDLAPSSYEHLRRVVKMAFAQRRKMMRNSLKPIWQPHLHEDDPILNLRPEQLSVDDFICLSKRLIT